MVEAGEKKSQDAQVHEKVQGKKDREIKTRRKAILLRKAYAKKRMGRFLRTLKKALYNEYVRGYMSSLRKAEK